MKILRIIARLNVGGPARHVVWLTKGLQDDEFESVLVAGRVPAGEQDMGYLAEANGVRPFYIDEMSRELSIHDAISLLKTYRTICREKPDIIHTHTAKAGTVGRLAAFMYRWLTWKTLIGQPRTIRVVHTFHGHVFHSYYGRFKTRVFIAIEKFLARFASDRIVVISRQQLDEINGRFGIGKKGQFSVIPLGIDLEPYLESAERRAAFRQELNADDGEIFVGFVGRLTEIKNISLYLQVAEQYVKRNYGLPKLRFIIAGDGNLREELEEEVAERRLDSDVVFVGNRPDIEVVYSGLDIVALTSHNEGTPLSLIEAMASRRPVISTTVGGVVDLLGDVREAKDGFTIHERGIGVIPNSLDGFLKGLIYLVKNERLRESLAVTACEFATEKYGRDRLVKEIRELYRGLMEQKGS
jgi:glycosyltransferase involved in cell wall biosynthesis